MSNAPQYCWLCTVIFTNLVVFSNVLATINHRIVKNLDKKKPLTKSKNISGHSPPLENCPGQLSPRITDLSEIPPVLLPPWAFASKTTTPE